MTLQAEIQKRQQAVSDLKRQVEQITALAGEDKKAGIRVADALRKRKVRASLKDVKIRDPADVQRRLANSADIYAFLSCYFPDVFWGDWTDQRREMVAAILNAAKYGGDQAIAAPRGEGKTSIVQCVTIYCVMHGILSFPLIAAATGPNAEQILANIKYQLERNQALADDYPEICDPILALDGTAQRGATQTANGKRTFLKWAQDYIVLPTVCAPDLPAPLSHSELAPGRIRLDIPSDGLKTSNLMSNAPTAVRVPAGRQRDELQRLPGRDRPGSATLARGPILDDDLVPRSRLRVEGSPVGRQCASGGRMDAPETRRRQAFRKSSFPALVARPDPTPNRFLRLSVRPDRVEIPVSHPFAFAGGTWPGSCPALGGRLG